jgi:hypothetical protein
MVGDVKNTNLVDEESIYPDDFQDNRRRRGRPRVRKFSSLWEILGAIEKDAANDDRITLFRGHTSNKHKLRPSIFRTPNERIKTNEHTVLSELIVRHPREFEGDSNIFENLVRVQHYGLPTRLLDFTSNPLFAVFFAAEKDVLIDPEVISISVRTQDVKYYDSDTVHLLANLAKLKSGEKAEIANTSTDDEVRNCAAGKRLVDFIAQARPNFANRIIRKDLDLPIVVLPKMNNERIRAQDGKFVIFGIVPELRRSDRFAVCTYRISKENVPSIRASLAKIGVTAATVYPSLQTSAEEIRTRYGLPPQNPIPSGVTSID